MSGSCITQLSILKTSAVQIPVWVCKVLILWWFMMHSPHSHKLQQSLIMCTRCLHKPSVQRFFTTHLYLTHHFFLQCSSWFAKLNVNLLYWWCMLSQCSENYPDKHRQFLVTSESIPSTTILIQNMRTSNTTLCSEQFSQVSIFQVTCQYHKHLKETNRINVQH